MDRNVAIDESLFLHDDEGNQIWVVGAIDITTKEIRLDVINQRNSANLKIFVINHIEAGSHIIHDGWRGYRFLDDVNSSVWTQEEHIHQGGNFGLGNFSTSNIERVWTYIKGELKGLYKITPHKNFIYFLKEGEYRYITSKMNSEQKEKKIKKILKFVYNLNNYEFFDEEEILDYNNYDF